MSASTPKLDGPIPPKQNCHPARNDRAPSPCFQRAIHLLHAHVGRSIQRSVSHTLAPKKAPRTSLSAQLLRARRPRGAAIPRRSPRDPLAPPAAAARPPHLPSSPARSSTVRHADWVPARDKRRAAPARSSGRRGWASGFRTQTSIFTVSQVKTSGRALKITAERGAGGSLLRLPVPAAAFSSSSPRSRGPLSPSLRGEQRWLTAVCPRGCETAAFRQRVPRAEGI